MPSITTDNEGDVHTIGVEWTGPAEKIADILPTTAFQRDYIRTQQNSYFIVKIPAQVDHQGLKAAVEAVMESWATVLI